MRTIIVVPHRGLHAGKTRLAGTLGTEQRVRLTQRLLERVLRALEPVDASCGVLVISPDADLRSVVEAEGARLLVQRGMGLNEGLDQARDVAVADGAEVLGVLHGDLPLLEPDDVQALLAPVLEAPGVAIAPDQTWSGTNGLAMRPPDAMDFRFGPGSFEAHLKAGRAAGVAVATVERPGLAFDLDTPGDLDRLLAGEAS